ncbi:MAG: gamma carbonic anhydrase family protein [Lachnospiraceae bacterium]|nr:gamma carbonic anhydrase family protein [Lachnospiraceae bacterium]
MILAEKVFIAQGARVIGDVVLKKGASVWYNAVVRGDHGRITIGENSNIQDNCTVHTEIGHELEIEAGVTVGHAAILHGEFIGENSLIGMGAILLNGTSIGKNCIVGAGALVTQNTKVPDGSLVFGSPAKVIRQLSEEEIASNRRNCEMYMELAREALLDE